MPRNITVHFGDEVYDFLQGVAAVEEQTIADVLQDAVTLKKLVIDTRLSGGRVLLEKADGSLTELTKP